MCMDCSGHFRGRGELGYKDDHILGDKDLLYKLCGEMHGRNYEILQKNEAVQTLLFAYFGISHLVELLIQMTCTTDGVSICFWSS